MSSIDTLADLFTRLPGIGPKQAKRFVYYLLRSDNYYKDNLIAHIASLKDAGKQCKDCLRFYAEERKDETTLCNLCRDESRDKGVLMLVEKELDIDAIEKTGSYNGLYFVLGGLLPLFADKPSDHINIKELVVRIHTKLEVKELQEIVFALPVTDLGDSTRDYIEKTIAQIVGIKEVRRSHLARGLSSGLELEYVDKDTFVSAFERRN
jgi:recombination protein RecR